MKRFSLFFTLIFLIFVLLSNSWADNYRIVGSGTTCEGSSSYEGAAVMCMTVSFTDWNRIRMELFKPDGKSFSDAYKPIVMMKRDSPDKGAPTLASALLEAKPSIILVSEYELDYYSFPSDNILKIYGRMDNSKDQWAWVGPVKIERIQPFPKPGLYSPVYNERDVSRLPQGFNWETLPGNPDSPTYRIVVSTKSDFSNFVDDENLGRYCTSSSTCWTKVTTGTSFPGFNLAYEQKYYWHVRAGNEKAGGDWSDTWSFTTETQKVPPIATIKYISPNPANNETSISFSGSGNDPDGGNIQSYSWRSSIDNNLSSYASFSRKLSVG
ncbi:conserved hypothetical protein, secreted, partial [Candidatus Magnetomorum sp. HK-1]